MTAARIEIDEGAWQQHPQSMLYSDRPIGHTVDRAFVGEGGYEGLIAFVKDSAIPGIRLQFDGVVITDEPPADPIPFYPDE